MKPLLLMIAVSLAVTAALAETHVEYDKAELRWDKKAFDVPPQVIGGYSNLAARFSYPRELRARRVEGAATVTVSLDSTGQVASVAFTPRIAPDLQQLVTAAVRGCHWKAGEKHGRRVAGRVWFPVKFVLRAP